MILEISLPQTLKPTPCLIKNVMNRSKENTVLQV